MKGNGSHPAAFPLVTGRIQSMVCPGWSTSGWQPESDGLPVDNESIANFEIESQTKEAKGAMNVEDFIAHSRADVAHADATSTSYR